MATLTLLILNKNMNIMCRVCHSSLCLHYIILPMGKTIIKHNEASMIKWVIYSIKNKKPEVKIYQKHVDRFANIKSLLSKM